MASFSVDSLYIATIATLVNNKKHFFYFFFWNEYGDPGNFESDEQLFGQSTTPGRRIRGPPCNRTIVRVFREIPIHAKIPARSRTIIQESSPAPKRPGHLLQEQPGESGRNTPIIPRSRGPMSTPTPIPNNSSETPDAAPDPPAWCAQWDLVGFTLY